MSKTQIIRKNVKDIIQLILTCIIMPYTTILLTQTSNPKAPANQIFKITFWAIDVLIAIACIINIIVDIKTIIKAKNG